jgi:glycosyltransferase involved in cell wall biosynthesis
MNSRRYRIALVTPFFPTRERPQDGRPTYELTKRLGTLADVSVFCPAPRYPRWISPRSFDYARVDTSYSLADVDVCFIEFPAVPALTRAVNGFSCANRLFRALRAATPDLILNYWLYPQGYAAVKVGQKLGVPAIVGTIGSDLNVIPDRISRFFIRETLQRAAAITCKSAALKNKAIALGAASAKVHSISNGCDTSIFHPAERSDARRRLGIEPTEELVLFVGRLEKAKGVMELVEAVSALTRTRPNLTLAFVGVGAAQSEIAEKVRLLGISDRVRFASGVPPYVVAQWYVGANLLVLPSYAEGCPNVVLEALNCGRPVIASNVGGVPEILSDECGILVKPRDAKGLSQAIDAGLNRAWGEQRIANSLRRSWGDMARETYDLCVSVIERAQPVQALAKGHKGE